MSWALSREDVWVVAEIAGRPFCYLIFTQNDSKLWSDFPNLPGAHATWRYPAQSALYVKNQGFSAQCQRFVLRVLVDEILKTNTTSRSDHIEITKWIEVPRTSTPGLPFGSLVQHGKL